jgi:hypothetical protein
MPTAEECKTYAAEYELLGLNADTSFQRSAMLLRISRSWSMLAIQLNQLAAIVEDESH